MSVETTARHQWAVLWAASGLDTHGRQTVEPPVEIQVRWKHTQRMGSDARGNPVSIDAQVVVAQDVPMGSVMWEGKLDDLPGTSYVPESDVMEVVGQDTVPDIKGRNVHRVLSLSRSSDSLPPFTA